MFCQPASVSGSSGVAAGNECELLLLVYLIKTIVCFSSSRVPGACGLE